MANQLHYYDLLLWEISVFHNFRMLKFRIYGKIFIRMLGMYIPIVGHTEHYGQAGTNPRVPQQQSIRHFSWQHCHSPSRPCCLQQQSESLVRIDSGKGDLSDQVDSPWA